MILPGRPGDDSQWRVEQILRDRLAEFGLAVESGVELRGFSAHADGVTATVSFW
jgi:hypothetical protein